MKGTIILINDKISYNSDFPYKRVVIDTSERLYDMCDFNNLTDNFNVNDKVEFDVKYFPDNQSFKSCILDSICLVQ